MLHSRCRMLLYGSGKRRMSSGEAASSAKVAEAGRGSDDRQLGIVASLNGNVHSEATPLEFVVLCFSAL